MRQHGTSVIGLTCVVALLGGFRGVYVQDRGKVHNAQDITRQSTEDNQLLLLIHHASEFEQYMVQHDSLLVFSSLATMDTTFASRFFSFTFGLLRLRTEIVVRRRSNA